MLGREFRPQNRTFDENQGFDVLANAWRTLAPLPPGSHATAAATDGNSFYVAGGSLTAPGK